MIMKINKKAQNITIAIIASIALIGFILGTFLDQKITGKIGDFDDFIGIFSPELVIFHRF